MKKIEPQNTIYKNYVSIIVLLLLVMSCGSKKNIQEQDVQIEQNPKLIFLNYIVFKDDAGDKQIQFVNKTITDGKLKKAATNYLDFGTIGDLKCTQLDKQSHELQTVVVKNPLSKIVEFVNDSLIFEKKQIDLKRGSLSLRLQLHSKTKSIVISEIIDSLQQSKTLIKTELD